MPNVRSQEALRNKFSGLQGRAQRRADTVARAELNTQRGQIQQFRQDITKAEEALNQDEGSQGRIDRINRIINRSLKKGSVGGEFQDLTREEKQLVRDAIKRAEDSRERSAVSRAEYSIEDQIGRKLFPSERQNIAEQIVNTGRVTLTLKDPSTLPAPLPQSQLLYSPTSLESNGISRDIGLSNRNYISSNNNFSNLSSNQAGLKQPGNSERFLSTIKESLASPFIGAGKVGYKTFKQINVPLPKYVESYYGPKVGGALYKDRDVQNFFITGATAPFISARIAYPTVSALAAVGAAYYGIKAVRQKSPEAAAQAVLLGAPLLVGAATSAIPKARSQTYFVGEQVAQQGDDLLFRTGAVTTRKGLLGDRQFVSAAETVVRSKPRDTNVDIFLTGTRGATREVKGYDIIRGRNVYSKESKPFVAIEQGRAIRQDANVLLGSSGRVQSRINIPDSTLFASASRTASKGAPAEVRANLGFTLPKGRDTVMMARSFPVRSINNRAQIINRPSNSLGLIRRSQAGETIDIISGRRILQSRGSSKKAIADTATRNAIETAISQQTKIRAPKNLFPITSVAVASQAPRIVSGQKGKESSYAGLGLYERSDQSFTPLVFQRPTTRPTIRQVSFLSAVLRLRNQIKQESPQPPRFRDQPLLTLGNPSRSASKQKSIISQFLSQAQRNRLGTPQARRPITTRTTRNPFFVNPPNKSRSKSGPRDSFDSILNIFVRRRGKDVAVGKSRTRAGAAQSLFGSLKGSLAASGFVTDTAGRRVDLSDFFGAEFSGGKRDRTRVVQQRGFRLGSGSERAQIQRARRESQSILSLGRRTGNRRAARFKWF